MRTRWELLVVPPLLLSLGLLVATQAIFIRLSFFEDEGLGIVGDVPGFLNYVQVFTDPFYLESLKITAIIALLVVAVSLLAGYPAAYVLARMPSRWAGALLAMLVASSFITIVIKVLGLIIIFGADGPLTAALRGLGIIEAPIRFIGNPGSVVIGLTQYTIGFFVILLFGVIQTVPRSLEEAAEIHGASRMRVMWRVVLPLTFPGALAGALIVFNLAMGAFTSAALLGGGRVLTVPVLIQRTLLIETKYGMTAALSVVLLASVMLINLVSAVLAARLHRGTAHAR
jgi:putative spermidine/putrescine transport system permease protein